jgi:hypothetical protein
MEPNRHPVVSRPEYTLDVTYTIADVVLIIGFEEEGERLRITFEEKGERRLRLNLAPSEATALGAALTQYAERARSGWA